MIRRYTHLLDKMAIRPELRGWVEQLPARIDSLFATSRHGHLTDWIAILESLPLIPVAPPILDSPTVQIAPHEPLNDSQRALLTQQLKRFIPWRKGPFNLLGIAIETEWRSDFKWSRVQQAIGPLKGRHLLDVGCGNGYYLWRALGDGAELAVGIDPYLLFVMQNHVIGHFMGDWANPVLPFGVEQLPPALEAFDLVLSMGILYHRRSPFDHLSQLHSCLQPGGQLLLETLVIPDGAGRILVPEDRYAKMRNVWFLPSVAELIRWLKRVGFINIELCSCDLTRPEEQRSTDWMPYESLNDYLDPADLTKTIEGYPAPLRALLRADRPE